MGDIPLPTKKSNKIREIVRLQQMLKKWKKAAIATSKNNDNNAPAATNKTTTAKGGLNKLLKKTLSFSEISSSSGEVDGVRKGYLAVWVGREEDAMKKKFVIPTDYLAHEAFSGLLRDAEEEFGFQQEGILNIPCDVPLFENILNLINKNQRPLKSSSSTSSFFLYQQQQTQPQSQPQPQPQPQPELLIINNNNHPPTPTTPTHHLPLYCR